MKNAVKSNPQSSAVLSEIKGGLSTENEVSIIRKRSCIYCREGRHRETLEDVHHTFASKIVFFKLAE